LRPLVEAKRRRGSTISSEEIWSRCVAQGLEVSSLSSRGFGLSPVGFLELVSTVSMSWGKLPSVWHDARSKGEVRHSTGAGIGTGDRWTVSSGTVREQGTLTEAVGPVMGHSGLLHAKIRAG
jgi:hypothetical protein